MESNHHGVAPASPSSWCVYQFRHHRKQSTHNFCAHWKCLKNLYFYRSPISREFFLTQPYYFIKCKYYFGCTTNIWDPFSSCRPILPEVFPSVTQLTTSESDNVIGPADTPVHSWLLQSLTDYGAAPRFHYTGANKQSTFFETSVPHPLLVFFEVADSFFALFSVVSR